MTPADVQELLELRRLTTGEPFDANGAKRDAWHDVLADYDMRDVMRRYRELVRSGTEKISLPLLIGGMVRDDNPGSVRNSNPGHDCEPGNGRTEWRCACGNLYLAPTHPRAIAAFERGLAEGRAQRRQERT